MNSLISLVVVDQEPRVDSRIVASQLDVEHESTRKIIEQYQADFEEFGVSRFEIGKPPKGSSGGRPEKFYLLNEDQSYLLLTYTQNTPQARELKKRLVRAFGEHRRALAAPDATPPPPKPDPAVLAQQLADLLQGTVLVDYDTLGQLTRTLWGAQGLLEGIEPLAQTLEQQCGKKLINKNFEQEPPRQPRQTRQLRQTLSSEDGKPSAYQKVLDFITTEKGKGVGDRALQSHCWPYRNLPADKREALIKQLLDDGAIVEVQPESKPGARRKALVYVAQSYAKAVS